MKTKVLALGMLVWTACGGGGSGGEDADAPSAVLSGGANPDTWILGGGTTGYGGHPANVTSVTGYETYVLVKSTGIPSYSIGPWPGNPNVAAPQNHVWYIPKSPVGQTGIKTTTPLGPIAVFTNGIPAFNALDAKTYNNQGVWHRNAHFWEGDHMDGANGHPAPGGVYHHHFHPVSLLSTHYPSFGPGKHSPIIGWSFDGFPIYGPYGFDPTGSSAIERMRSSFKLRSMTQRTTMPDGSAAAFPGPDVTTAYPLGAFIEDYEYVEGWGHLDKHNGHFGVTPDYPTGLYHYHITLDASEADGEYPYLLGPTYYGVVDARNFD